MSVDGTVHLTGTLTCTTRAECDRVIAGLDTHIALTRAEPGCISFEVVQSADPMIWTVAETFTDRAAFAAHQSRTAASDWARLTKGIARNFIITGPE